jgi:DNA-binding XRE family transcriptional regulator
MSAQSKTTQTEGGNQMAMLLKAARINAEKTQEEVATYLGKTRMTIRSYETYKTKPDVETAKKIAEFYGMSIDDIVWNK